MSAANVKLNHALSPEPSQNVKGDSIETSVANEPIHVNNTRELSEAMQTVDNKVIILDFFANWCAPCRLIAPKLVELHHNYPNIVVIKADVDEAEDLCMKYDIGVVPTFLAFKGGDEIERLTGSDISKIEDFFKKHN